jgi:hypothetical protein
MHLKHTSTHAGLLLPANNRKVYKRTHFLLFTGSGGSNAARIASSNTFFNPFWEQHKTHIKHNFREAKYPTCTKHVKEILYTEYSQHVLSRADGKQQNVEQVNCWIKYV